MDEETVELLPPTRYGAAAGLVAFAALIGTVLIASVPGQPATAGMSGPISGPVSGPVSGPAPSPDDGGTGGDDQGDEDDGEFVDPLTGSFDRDAATGDDAGGFLFPISGGTLSPPMIGGTTTLTIGNDGFQTMRVQLACVDPASDEVTTSDIDVELAPVSLVTLDLDHDGDQTCFLWAGGFTVDVFADPRASGPPQLIAAEGNVTTRNCQRTSTFCEVDLPEGAEATIVFVTESMSDTGLRFLNETDGPLIASLSCFPDPARSWPVPGGFTPGIVEATATVDQTDAAEWVLPDHGYVCEVSWTPTSDGSSDHPDAQCGAGSCSEISLPAGSRATVFVGTAGVSPPADAPS